MRRRTCAFQHTISRGCTSLKKQQLNGVQKTTAGKREVDFFPLGHFPTGNYTPEMAICSQSSDLRSVKRSHKEYTSAFGSPNQDTIQCCSCYGEYERLPWQLHYFVQVALRQLHPHEDCSTSSRYIHCLPTTVFVILTFLHSNKSQGWAIGICQVLKLVWKRLSLTGMLKLISQLSDPTGFAGFVAAKSI